MPLLSGTPAELAAKKSLRWAACLRNCGIIILLGMPWHECRLVALKRTPRTRWTMRGKGRKHVGRDESRMEGEENWSGLNGSLRTSLFTWSRYASWPSRRARANNQTCTLLYTWSGSCRLIGKIHEEDRALFVDKSRVKHARKWHDRGLKLDRSATLDREMRGFRGAISGRGRKVHRVVSLVVNCQSCLVRGQSVLCNELIPWKRL